MANSLFKASLYGLPSNTPPIWFMRQAGRYHSHYQALRAQHSFVELCKDADLAAEVAFGPVEEFDFDVSIMFSDLLFPLEAFGMDLEYSPGPKFSKHFSSEMLETFKQNQATAIDKLKFQSEVLKATREKLPFEKSLIGFVGSPWTLFIFAMVGSHKADLSPVFANMDLYPKFCEYMIPLLKKNIQLQIDSGAEIVMVFDTAAGELPANEYNKTVFPQIKDIVNSFPQQIGYYSKKTTVDHLENFKSLNELAGIGFDHNFDLPALLKEKTFPGFIQGNFNQEYMTLDDDQEFLTKLNQWLQPFKELSPEQRQRWVCGLGHGMIPAAKEKNVKLFIKTLREAFPSNG